MNNEKTINWTTERKYGADLSLAEAYDEVKKVSVNGKIDSRAYSLHQSELYWEQMRRSEACYETVFDWIDGGSDGEDLRYISELIECDDEDMRELAEWGFTKEEAEDIYKASQDSSIDLDEYIYDNYVEIKEFTFEDWCFVFDKLLIKGEDFVRYKCPICGEETLILNKELCQEINAYDLNYNKDEERYEEDYGEYWGKCWNCREYIKKEDLKDIIKEEGEL